MSTFALKKEWRDVEPGVDMVEIRYACAAGGEQPDWAAAEESRVLVPRGDDPLPCRGGAIELPRGLGGAPAYTLYYYFLVIQQGRQRTLPVVGEQIVSRELAYHDARGRYGAVAVQWSVGDTTTPNYTPLVGEPLTPSDALSLPRFRPSAPPEALPAAGLSRVFKGCVWGPRGATVYHVFHLRPLAAPDGSADREFWDTNGGRLWQVVL